MRKSKSFGDHLVTILAYLFIGLFGLLCLYPLVLTLGVSLSSEHEIVMHGYSAIPQKFTLNTYIYIFANSGMRILKSYGVTIFVTVAGTVGAMIITSMIAFALSIKSLKYRNVIAFLCNFTIVFSAGLIPWYVVCVNYYGLKNNILALILPSIFSVWNMFLMRTYFSSISPSLYEAAKIDGASYMLIYWRIALPLSKTAVLTVGLMYALQYWNDWWNALIFINDKDLFPLQYYLYTILSNVNAISSGRIPSGAAAGITLPSETMKMAVTVITIGPIIFLYPFVQKYFVQGIMTGAVKE
ncbi:carbohydrate ABC transporter permease [Lacrimispora sp.]|jgi:putative aldouronate transport system permease protein|uniref:carbohydrate ABC transporter permease n=1 Tax=Lacrimispora sp. TaxID=2719234 RepID=UPI002896FCEA|nr:carbohydrate ABC transporter permease [Lacrimispora sp.]